MKQILLIDREFGAGGSPIAELLARRLNWKLFDDALTEEIARLARIPTEVCKQREERRDPWAQRLINVIWRGSVSQHAPSPETAILDSDCLVSIVQRVIEEAAEKNPCVIVGRGAPYFLRKRTDTFCVFLYASRDIRFRRVLQRVDGDQKKAVELVDTMDEERGKFVKHQFGHEWPNRHLFHAMLDTAAGYESTAETIVYLLNAANQKEGSAKS